MVYIIFVIIIVSLYFNFKYFLVNKELKNLNKKLIHSINNNFNGGINVNLINKNLNNLVTNINKLTSDMKNTINGILKNEENFKELLTNISHDIRTPLTAIKSYTQILNTNNNNLTDNQKNYLQTIINHTNSLQKLSERFFLFSYLNDVEIKPNIEKVNVVNTVT